MPGSAAAPDPEDVRRQRQQERKRLSREKYNAADPERARQQHRDSQRRSRERARAEQARRERDRARVKAWAAANPERTSERRQAWTEKNPDRVREHKRNYYYRNRESRQAANRDQNTRRRQDPDQRERARKYQADHREHLNAKQNARRADPEVREKHNREQNERRRRERRRRNLGLPPRPMHRATLNERARNAAAADAFFARTRTKLEVRLLREELTDVRAEAALSSDAHWKAELAARIRTDAAKPARIAGEIDHYLSTRAGAILREEVRMDSIARDLHGAGHYPDAVEEVRRRAATALEARRAALHGPAHSPNRERMATRPAPPVPSL